jgi:hypothetical protein
MGLCAAAHPSHVLDSFYRHGGILAFSNEQSALSNQPNQSHRKERKERKGTKTNQLPASLWPLRPSG